MYCFQKQRVVILLLIFFILFSGVGVVTHSIEISNQFLPAPEDLSLSIDEIIQKRTSIREFEQTPLSEYELSTLLWHAYGLRDDGVYTIPSMQSTDAVVLYLLLPDGIYQYDPVDHILDFYASGDYRYIGQYEAPLQLGLCWNITKLPDKTRAGMQIGAVGQNIYHACVAMGLGTVATGEIPCPLDSIGLPEEHKGMIVMPIGVPAVEAKYRWLPLWISPLPKVQDADVSFTDAINQWNLSKPFTHSQISDQMLSQFLWSCYGYSSYLDHSGFEMHYIERHRTVPSAHGYYPLEVYAISEDAVSWYIPGLRNNDPVGLPIVSFLWKILREDVRSILAESTTPKVQDAALNLVICLNIEDSNQRDDLSDPLLRWIWSYEAGACVQNLLLDTTAWGYTMHIHPITHKDTVLETLGLNQKYDPFVLVCIG